MSILAYLSPVTFFHSWVTEYSYEWDEFQVVFDLVGKPVQHLEGTFEGGAFLVFLVSVDLGTGVEFVDEFDRFRVHLFDLFLDGVQG